MLEPDLAWKQRGVHLTRAFFQESKESQWPHLRRTSVKGSWACSTRLWWAAPGSEPQPLQVLSPSPSRLTVLTVCLSSCYWLPAEIDVSPLPHKTPEDRAYDSRMCHVFFCVCVCTHACMCVHVYKMKSLSTEHVLQRCVMCECIHAHVRLSP